MQHKNNESIVKKKRFYLDDWAAPHFRDASLTLGLKLRHSAIAAIDLLCLIAKKRDFRANCQKQGISIIEGVEKAIDGYSDDPRQSARTSLATERENKTGIGSVLSLPEFPRFTQKPKRQNKVGDTQANESRE
ncbi:hypothetical protein [Aestuariispira insulae]|uniref:hypothetical protein n=1 Tax=Aestuariispira insulae TaxID=1461337 RepID=UPI000E27D611|nr:hypothetical protein [Aestuariispira insulae]